jgi:hypothetical protein
MLVLMGGLLTVAAVASIINRMLAMLVSATTAGLASPYATAASTAGGSSFASFAVGLVVGGGVVWVQARSSAHILTRSLEVRMVVADV